MVGGPVAAGGPTTPGLSTRVGGLVRRTARTRSLKATLRRATTASRTMGHRTRARDSHRRGTRVIEGPRRRSGQARRRPTKRPARNREPPPVRPRAARARQATNAGCGWPTRAPIARRSRRRASKGGSRLCARLDARRLLVLGHVARYAGSDGRARKTFRCLVRRFGHDRLASDAVFSLASSRLRVGRSLPNQAQRWFGLYLSEWPKRPARRASQWPCAGARFASRTKPARRAPRTPTWPNSPTDRTPRWPATSCVTAGA